MLFRRFGKTNLNLSVLSLGTRKFEGQDDSENHQKTRERFEATLRRARELGVNHLVTCLGENGNLRVVGEALSAVGRDAFHITCKLEPRRCAGSMERCLAEVLEQLATDHIDVLMLHGVNNHEQLNLVTCPNGCMKTVEEARERGSIRHVGFSSCGPAEFIQKAMNSELFDAINIHYSYFNPRNEPIIQRAGKMEIGVLVGSPTEMGGRLRKPPALLMEQCEPFHPMTINDRFILQQPGVTTLTVGAQRPDDFDHHLAALEVDGPLTDAETVALARLDVRRLQLPGTWCTFCHDCLPCPEGVHIPEALRLRNLALAYDMEQYARARYAELGGGNHWTPGAKGDRCTDCGDCVPRCPERLDIPALLRETHHLLSGRRVGAGRQKG